MSNIAAQAASLGLSGSQLANAAVQSMGSGLIAGQTAAQYANTLAQQQLASQTVTPLGQAQSAAMNGITLPGSMAGIAAGVAAGAGGGAAGGGAEAAENNAIQAAQEAAMVNNSPDNITASTAVGDAPIATLSNFNPRTRFAASRMFGAPRNYFRKPLINL